MEVKDILYITEENVDGCGDSASDLYGIDHAMTDEEKVRLNAALAEAKRTADDDCSTGEMIDQAMDATFGPGKWKILPYHEVFF